MSSPLDQVIRFPPTTAISGSSISRGAATARSGNSRRFQRQDAPSRSSRGLRRSATTSTCLENRVHSQRAGSSGGSNNSQWDLGKTSTTDRKNNMFLQDANMSREASLTSMSSATGLKSCLSVGSHQESLEQSWNKKSGMQKNVSFDSIHIREHPRTVGDNPSVSRGPPVSLGWYNEETCTTTSLPLDDYEQDRPERKKSGAIVLSRNLRESLLRDFGATTVEMTKVTREVDRVKKERFKTLSQVQARGESGEQQQLAMEKAKRKLQRLVGAKKSSKQEQEELWKRAAKYRTQSLAAIPEVSQSMPVLHGRPRENRRPTSKNAVWTTPEET